MANTGLLIMFTVLCFGEGRMTIQEVAAREGASSSALHRVVLESTPLTNELLVRISELTRPSVVNVSTIGEMESPESREFPPLFEDPFFRRFFGDEFERRIPPPGQFRQKATGSGVIVSADGYIITNNHVVEQAKDIQVLLSDKRQMTARLIGTDPKTDLAVLKIDATGLPFLKWGDSSRLKVGEVVLALGSPFGLNQTVTMGIVSAVGRANVGIVDYEDFIQTDAAINPGNSGGALVNLKGELIGINTAIFSQSGGYMGIGFAIPSAMAKTVAKALMEQGKVVRGWLGVSIQGLTPELVEQFHAPDAKGALVSHVAQDSPAEKGGLKTGDIIREYHGKPVADPVQLRNFVAETPPGTGVSLTILREGKKRTIHLTVREQPREMPAVRGPGEAEGRHALSGVLVETVPPEAVPQHQGGVIVRDIKPGSPADRAGLRIDDVIVEMNRTVIRDVADFDRVVKKLGRDQAVLLLVRRGSGVFFVPVKP